MRRTVIVVGSLLFGSGVAMAQQELAVKQDNLMRAQGKSLYGIVAKMAKGEIPYDQKAVDQALADLEKDVKAITTTFATDPKQDVVDAKYGSSPKIWQNRADFDAKVPPVQKALADVTGKIDNVATLKAAFTTINERCNDCHDTYRLKLK